MRSHPKEARPLSTKEPVHIVLISEWAIGPSSLLQHADFVDRTIRAWAKKCGVKIYELVNVGNHFRTITALIARHVGQRNRGVGRDWENILKYMEKNRKDAQSPWGRNLLSFHVPGFDYGATLSTA
ncbi:MAG: hypothetical protein JNM39_11580 [Bdellovibrionaceae bacterium]|nr:hypothetical protein [Pseudobdellovibrionaceae bacterium]